MSARPVHVPFALGAGMASALAMRIAVSALDDSTLYITATTAALALSGWAWWIARRRANAEHGVTSSNSARGRVIAAFGAGAAALLLLLELLAPSVPPLPSAARAQALSAIDVTGASALELASAWDGSGHAAAFAFESAAQDLGAFGVLLRDGVPAAPVVLRTGAELDALCEHGLPSLAYARPHARVLVAGGAGNLDLECARHYSAQSIDVVEPSAALHALATRVGQGRAAAQLHWHAANPRTFARAHAKRYDLVVLPARLDTAHTWPAGMLPVREATLETEAGIAALLDALVPAGALFATVNGEPAALRFVVTALAALQSLGVEHPELHLAVHQSGDAYGVLVKRERFVLDEVLDLHQQNRTRKPLAELPWFDGLLRGAEQPPALRSTPGAPFLNRFGQLLAPSPKAASVFAEHYLFDISAPNDTRPLFYETSRIDQPQSLSVHSASRVLPALVLIVFVVVLGLTVAAGSSLAPTAFSRVRALSAPIAMGCAQGLAYAWVQHALGLWLIPSYAFACMALAGALGAWLGFALAVRTNAAAPAWLAFAYAAGFALSLPLAAALVLFASYQAVAIGAGAWLALLALAALRKPA